MLENNQFRGLKCSCIDEAKIVLVGIPYDKGCSCAKGASKAPQTIRELSKYLPPFSKDGISLTNTNLYDYGNILCSSLDEIRNNALPIFNYNMKKIFIGGDHSVSIPLQSLFFEHCQKNNKIPVIIHIDAHADICDKYDGSIYSHACINKRAIDKGYLPENITMIGIRSYEQQELDYLKLHPELIVYTSSYINDNGIDKMIKEVVNKYTKFNNYAIYLSYDIDANDPIYAPGTGTPEAFGLSSLNILKILLSLISELNIEIIDIVEVSPPLDNNNLTSWLALKTLYEIFTIY